MTEPIRVSYGGVTLSRTSFAARTWVLTRVGRWRSRLGKIAHLGLHDWRLFAEAVASLMTVQVGLHVIEFPRLLSWATRTRRVNSATPSREQICRTTWLVDVGSRLLRLRCLTRSLALARMLGRRGVATELRIGVRTEEGVLQAHAWIECMGRPLNDDGRTLLHFAVFDRALGEISNA